MSEQTENTGAQGKDSPRLAAPGAGIPWLERKMLGRGLRLYVSAADRGKAMARFTTEAEELLASAAALDEETGRTPVLVPRLRGMEDSSRFWSPYMILQHVTIIDHGVLMVVQGLAAGKTFAEVRGTADVKPSRDAGPETISAFRETVAAWQEKIGKIPELKTRVKHPHPWFGPLDAFSWVCIAGLHHGIHRRQMEQVLRGARRP